MRINIADRQTYDRLWYKNNRAKILKARKVNTKNVRLNNRLKIYEYLENKSCIDCGNNNPIVLDFDHINPTDKSHNVSNMMGYSWERILEEINKCEIRCANCHRIKTAKDQGWYNLYNK